MCSLNEQVHQKVHQNPKSAPILAQPLSNKKPGKPRTIRLSGSLTQSDRRGSKDLAESASSQIKSRSFIFLCQLPLILPLTKQTVVILFIKKRIPVFAFSWFFMIAVDAELLSYLEMIYLLHNETSCCTFSKDSLRQCYVQSAL